MRASISECNTPIKQLKGECAFPSTNTYPCSFCEGGVEFFDGLQCQTCDILQCNPGGVKQDCCGEVNTKCTYADTIETCGNSIHDYGEECDRSDSSSPLRDCCQPFICKLKLGYYNSPACVTVCGDGLTAGSEECDEPSSYSCDNLTCKYI